MQTELPWFSSAIPVCHSLAIENNSKDKMSTYDVNWLRRSKA